MKKILLAITSILLITACSSIESKAPDTNSVEEQRREARGKLTGEDGISFGGGKRKDEAAYASPLGVNSFLWRATLDTLSFMPLASADPFGGVIITDWYEEKELSQRYKINALILDKTLRADGIKITLFKQSMDKNGNWHDIKSDPADARKIEDTILTRARELKIRQGR